MLVVALGQEGADPVLAPDFVEAIARDRLHVGIEANDPPLRIEHEDYRLCGGDQVFGKVLLFLQRLLGPHAIGDIQVASVHPNGLARVVQQHLSACKNPPVASILVPQTELDDILVGLPLAVGPHRPQSLLAVFRVQAAFPFLVYVGKFIFGVADLGLPLGGKVDLVSHQVPVPDADASRLQREFKALLHALQRHLGFLALCDVFAE